MFHVNTYASVTKLSILKEDLIDLIDCYLAVVGSGALALELIILWGDI